MPLLDPFLFGDIVKRHRGRASQDAVGQAVFGGEGKAGRVSGIEKPQILDINDDDDLKTLRKLQEFLSIQDHQLPIHPDLKKLNERAELLDGHWIGYANQPNEPNRRMTVDATFERRDYLIEGKATFDFTDDDLRDDFTIAFIGDAPHTDYIRLQYNGTDKKQNRFGVCLAEIDNIAESLDGFYIGFGPTADGLVQGKIVLNKVAPSDQKK